MSKTQYHNPYSCNKCGGVNRVKCDPFDVESSGETETICNHCGHKDYWAHGFFESSEDGLDKCSKYTTGQEEDNSDDV